MKTPRVPFEDAQELARLHPATFEAPSPQELAGLKKGDMVKVCTGDERFWVELEQVEGERLTGLIDNDLLHTHLHGLVADDRITFAPRHIYAVDSKDAKQKGTRTMPGKFASLLFRAKVMKVLRMELQFKPNLRGGARKLHFRGLCEAVLGGGGNEYDGAAIYLLDQLDRTREGWKQQGSGLTKQEQAEYVQQKHAAIEALLPKTNGLAEKRLRNS